MIPNFSRSSERNASFVPTCLDTPVIGSSQQSSTSGHSFMSIRASPEIASGSNHPRIREAAQHTDAIREFKYDAAIAAVRFGSSFAQSSKRYTSTRFAVKRNYSPVVSWSIWQKISNYFHTRFFNSTNRSCIKTLRFIYF